MPTYEYSCDACGHGFEKEQRITDKPIKKCPQCGKLKARRLIGSGNFILKGSGWYSDLYSGPSNRKEEAKSNGASDKQADGSGKEAGAESKGTNDSKSSESSSSKDSKGTSESKGSSSKPASSSDN